MKELIIKKGEVIRVYIYENGKCIKKFDLTLNCNYEPYKMKEIKGVENVDIR